MKEISNIPNGLLVLDGKKIVEQTQKAVIYDQFDEVIRESRVCPDFASVRAIHDDRTRDLYMLFGRVRVSAFSGPKIIQMTKASADRETTVGTKIADTLSARRLLHWRHMGQMPREHATLGLNLSGSPARIRRNL